MQRFAFAVLASATVAACELATGSGGPRVTDLGPGTDIPAPAASYGAAQVQAARQACNAPHGPAQSYATLTDLAHLVVGPWLRCDAAGDGDAGAAASDWPSLPSAVWSSDGSWRALVDDGQGGLVEGQGLQETGVFTFDNGSDSSDACHAEGAQCVLSLSQGGGWDNIDVGFEAGPRRMLLEGTQWYVAIE